MGILEFIFAVLIVIPVALVMLFIFRKLTGEYNAAIKKERDMNRRKMDKKNYNYSRER